jgi:hypothetical protein
MLHEPVNRFHNIFAQRMRSTKSEQFLGARHVEPASCQKMEARS